MVWDIGELRCCIFSNELCSISLLLLKPTKMLDICVSFIILLIFDFTVVLISSSFITLIIIYPFIISILSLISGFKSSILKLLEAARIPPVHLQVYHQASFQISHILAIADNSLILVNVQILSLL
jgi:hypothetical protein